jgi:sirohydrochlorin ferrochelatase
VNSISFLTAMPSSPSGVPPVILLVDNGSLEPAATLSLRRIAHRLGERLGQPIAPVSLLHSSAIPATALEAGEAEILEPALERRLKTGQTDFLVVPLFFGPSGALTDYLPKRVAALKRKFSGLSVRVAPPLIDGPNSTDPRMAAILEAHVRHALSTAGETNIPSDRFGPAVILVDHGSPVRAVTAVRDQLAAQLRERLGSSVRSLNAASMERRPGADYDFCEPLLERAFDLPGLNTGTVLVAMMFLSPGRHAGAEGDVARICTAARQRHPGLRTIMTDLVGSHPDLISILADRTKAGLASAPL